MVPSRQQLKALQFSGSEGHKRLKAGGKLSAEDRLMCRIAGRTHVFAIARHSASLYSWENIASAQERDVLHLEVICPAEDLEKAIQCSIRSRCRRRLRLWCGRGSSCPARAT